MKRICAKAGSLQKPAEGQGLVLGPPTGTDSTAKLSWACLRVSDPRVEGSAPCYIQ
uniref:Uncharacterized protein n=1 Tax=Rhizophora mucronata TaxID=61149 RepID=A0A2P2J745_RHIMU